MERWRLWLCRLLIAPLAAMSGGLLFVLYRAVVTGHITAVSRGWKSSDRVIYFADSPVGFLLYFLLIVIFTCVVILVTVVVIRMALKKS
ncbi:MAG TPA: hypothetical protein VER55_15690, partial [Ardenticatenaceae bacterium]|nr:hypothetical protein [Ardenticatenaceae bacterium]